MINLLIWKKWAIRKKKKKKTENFYSLQDCKRFASTIKNEL